MAHTPWIGGEADKLYLQSGQFSSTLKTSRDISGIDSTPTGISYDGTNTPWSGNGDEKLYIQSGQFSATIKTSIDIGSLAYTCYGISYDGTNTPWCTDTSKANYVGRLYLQSGQISSTMKTSLTPNVGEGNYDISYDGTNTPHCYIGKLVLQSGQFSSTIKDSLTVTSPMGISYDGTNTPYTKNGKLYLQSGQFSSTMKTSLDASGIDNSSQGICTNDVDSRLGGGSSSSSSSSYRKYTKGNYTALPADDTDLESGFTTDEYDDVASDDSVRVNQLAVGEFALKQFKDKENADICFSITWNGQSDIAPSVSTVYLQVYNRTLAVWKTVDSNSSAAANTDFTLSSLQPESGDALSDYYDANHWISCRIYQEAK